MRCDRGGRSLQGVPRQFVPAARGIKRHATGFGIGQCSAGGLGRVPVSLRRFLLIRQISQRAIDLGAASGQALGGGFGLVERAQSVAFVLGGSRDKTLQCNQFGLQAGQLRLRILLPGQRILQRFSQRWQLYVEFVETVLRFQPRRLRRAFASRDKPIPAPQRAIKRHQPVTGRKRSSVVALRDMHQRQPRSELWRATGNVRGEAVCNRRGRSGTRPEAALLAIWCRA